MPRIWRTALICLAICATCAASSDVISEGCATGSLDITNRHTPPISLHHAVMLQLRPRSMVKIFQLVLVLETTRGQEVYHLTLDADMGVHWGDVSLALRDVKASQNVMKVSWPPILLHGLWTILYVRLPLPELFQLAVIPKEAQERPDRSMENLVTPTPMALSTRLSRSGITRIRLQLLSNTTLEYKVNCDRGEYLATSFAAAFGMPSSAPVWRTWVWILLSLFIVLAVVMVSTAAIMYLRLKVTDSFSFHFKKKDAGIPEVVTTVYGEEKANAATEASADGLRPPRVTTGVVSSRAPSPGVEVDENTFDYINKAFTHESDHETS